jgi:hypothetical protein
MYHLFTKCERVVGKPDPRKWIFVIKIFVDKIPPHELQNFAYEERAEMVQ